jgi:hypothetical protein
MKISCVPYHLSLLSCLGLVLLAHLATSSAEAETKASCQFTLFPRQFETKVGTIVIYPSGVNDFGTVVGGAFSYKQKADLGFIRWSGGGVTLYDASSMLPNASRVATAFVDRNNKGVTTGYAVNLTNDKWIVFALKGSQFTPIELIIGSQVYKSFAAMSINKWGSIVGYYQDANFNFHGFKRWRRHGHGFNVDFPGAKETVASGINDNGTIVGTYRVGIFPNEQRHGFIYHNGEWATLDYPSSTRQTMLVGISNSGLIVGTTIHGNVFEGSFLYQNGVFKVIPNLTSVAPAEVTGISPRSGLITGLEGSDGFIATCH